ncbi:MAG TPA: asparagine synthase-related protein [Candidatus Sulfotelmatobacter sp.]|nr:asparagine synthase-related protein [Candidatus Sulfotelmatobacter sp.]
MSGFFGIVRTDGAAVEPRFLEQVAQRLRFRGPDGAVTSANGGFGTSFTYLETGTPHQSRSQPVRLGERYTLLGEVRLDARKQLVEELQENRLATTQETSDEELLLLAWSVWGEGSLAKILGDYSFAVWDAAQKSLCCARDFNGPRPFFYAWRNGAFCFSNTMQVLRMVPELSAELDDAFVRDFLLEGICNDPERSIWRDVRRLPAGHLLQWKEGSVHLRRFLQLPVEEPLRFKEPGQCLENYRELLVQAVADRLPEGNASLYLSGGLDSGSVCAVAARLAAAQGNSEKLKAFTISWKSVFDDPEPGSAGITARYLGLPHETLGEDTVHSLNAVVAEPTPEPTSDLFHDRACRIFKKIAAHSPVVLSGDGGDNVLTGQAWPYFLYLRARGDWREIARSFGGYFGEHLRFPALRGGFRGKLRRWFGGAPAATEIPLWLNEGFSKRCREHTPGGCGTPEPVEAHPLHPQGYASLHSGYWASVLEDEDAGWTGIRLESRAPILDIRLLRFLLRLPPVPWCVDKEVTRRAMKTWLPLEILTRPKTPLLQDPLVAWQMRTGWRPKPEENPPAMVHEFVNWKDWRATLENTKGFLSWGQLSPLSLALWLKDIENREGIEYSARKGA